MIRRKSSTVITLLALLAAAGPTPAAEGSRPTVEVFAAGSLRGVVKDLGAAARSTLQIDVTATFGGSGSLRERIEQGERPDLLLSADLASPRKLAAGGVAVFAPVAFARNRMCVVSRRDTGLTATNLIERLLQPQLRLRTSTPVADPSGDYAWAMFDRIEKLRPGAGARLKDKASGLMNATATPASPDHSAAAALFASRQIDVSITYCSAAAGLLRELPELASLVVPESLDPRPVYGIAVLSDKPAALRLALFLLSEKGQSLIADNGLLPVLDLAKTSAP